MILATHAIVGASVAQFFPQQPILAFSAGFISHFILDAIPHPDYQLSSFKRDNTNHLKSSFGYDKKFILDLFKIAIDLIIGLLLVFLAYVLLMENIWWLVVLVGTVGAILPDFLQFVYFNFRHEPLVTLQKFHIWIHRQSSEIKKGIISQLAVISFFILVMIVLN